MAASRHGKIRCWYGMTTREAILDMLERVRSGDLHPTEAVGRLANLPYEDTGFAKIDHHRSLRLGLPEVIYAAGKTPAQTAEIFPAWLPWAEGCSPPVRDEAIFAAVSERVPEAEYHSIAKVIALNQGVPQSLGPMGVLCAGTSDLPVAEEAAVTAECMGASVRRFYDVGVAGLHRLLAHREALQECDVVIVCAGMEGALPSVVGGLVGAPVIAVPTSVGYGCLLWRLAALLGMLNSCSPNVTAVNIDNGFGAAYAAAMVLRRIQLTLAKSESLTGKSHI